MLLLEKREFTASLLLCPFLPQRTMCCNLRRSCRQGIRESQAICLESARGWETTCLLVFILCTAFGETH